MIILQTPNGFFLCTDTDFSLEKGAEFSLERAIPAIELKGYNYNGKSVLEQVEQFFKEPPAEKT
jgi:hypothetical protein